MGITIHFEGNLKNEENYVALIEKMTEFCKFQEWNFFLFENENKLLQRVENETDRDYEGSTKGIQVQPHENSEPLIFEFDNELYIQEYCKTQFSDVETHLKIIELLNVVENYFENIAVFDEGEFWETNDINLLQKHWDNFHVAMEKAIGENDKLRGPFKMENGRIIDLM